MLGVNDNVITDAHNLWSFYHGNLMAFLETSGQSILQHYSTVVSIHKQQNNCDSATEYIQTHSLFSQ